MIDSQERSESMANSISFCKSLWNAFNNLPIKVEQLKQQVAFDRTQVSFPFAHIAFVFNDPVDNAIKKDYFHCVSVSLLPGSFLLLAQAWKSV